MFKQKKNVRFLFVVNFFLKIINFNIDVIRLYQYYFRVEKFYFINDNSKKYIKRVRLNYVYDLVF